MRLFVVKHTYETALGYVRKGQTFILDNPSDLPPPLTGDLKAHVKLNFHEVVPASPFIKLDKAIKMVVPSA